MEKFKSKKNIVFVIILLSILIIFSIFFVFYKNVGIFENSLFIEEHKKLREIDYLYLVLVGFGSLNASFLLILFANSLSKDNDSISRENEPKKNELIAKISLVSSFSFAFILHLFQTLIIVLKQPLTIIHLFPQNIVLFTTLILLYSAILKNFWIGRKIYLILKVWLFMVAIWVLSPSLYEFVQYKRFNMINIIQNIIISLIILSSIYLLKNKPNNLD